MPAGSPAGLPGLVPCTPLGCVMLAKTVHASLAGLEAVVVGRSNIVGKPVAQLLLAENATVTIAHSKTRDLPAVCGRADLLVAAIGQPGIGARPLDQAGRDRDRCRHQSHCRRAAASRASSATSPMPRPRQFAGAITPVPGGVGPMTIACLLLNTLRAACMQNGLPAPKI